MYFSCIRTQHLKGNVNVFKVALGPHSVAVPLQVCNDVCENGVIPMKHIDGNWMISVRNKEKLQTKFLIF